MAGREDLGPLPELPGDFGVRSREGRPQLRVLRLVVARPVRTGQGRVPAGVAAAAQDLRAAGARPDSRVVRPAVVRAERVQEEGDDGHRAGVYLPYWTFDAKADARWTAEAGDYYYVQQGKQRVRRVRWYPASGALSHVFDDDLVCASTGVHAGMLRGIEPFPTTDLVPYDPGYLAGWTVERYQIDLIAAAERSRQQMDATLRSLCESQVPGDTHRNLVVNATYSNQTFKHILAPIWLLTYVYRGDVVSGRGQRRHRPHRRVAAVELDQDRAAGARRAGRGGDHCGESAVVRACCGAGLQPRRVCRPEGPADRNTARPWACHLLSQRDSEPSAAPTRPALDTLSNQPGSRSKDANAVATSRRARSRSSGNAAMPAPCAAG